LVAERDIWAEWLLHRRFGGDKEELQRMLDFLNPVRDKVLANARIAEGETLLDVGAGDGLIAFGALEQVGPTGKVILSDISQDLLDHDRTLAEQMDVLDRCEFVYAAAEDLSPIPDTSVDIVTTRSVLIYVDDKQRAFEEFFRVLRPGGRISLFEPINRFGYAESPDCHWGFDVSPVQDIAAKLRSLYQSLQPLDEDPMMNFDERDLLAFAELAGFAERHLEFRADIERRPPWRWETYSQTAFNPRIPTLAEAMAQVLTPEEAERYEAHLKPLVEKGEGTFPLASAYLWAVKE
jgi:arsenite methyltransferase